MVSIAIDCVPPWYSTAAQIPTPALGNEVRKREHAALMHELPVSNDAGYWPAGSTNFAAKKSQVFA